MINPKLSTMKKLILINASVFSGLYMQAQETVVYNAGCVGALIWAITDTTEKEFDLKYNLNESSRANQNSADETET